VHCFGDRDSSVYISGWPLRQPKEVEEEDVVVAMVQAMYAKQQLDMDWIHPWIALNWIGSISQSISQSINQSINQAINQSIHPSINQINFYGVSVTTGNSVFLSCLTVTTCHGHASWTIFRQIFGASVYRSRQSFSLWLRGEKL